MNKKICKLILILLICIFGCMEYAFAAIKIESTGNNGAGAVLYDAGDFDSSYTDIYAFRLTFVDKDGNKISGTKSVDYYTDGNYSTIDCYFNPEHYKFSYINISNLSCSNSKNVSTSISKGSYNFSSNEAIKEFWDEKLGVGKTSLPDSAKTIISNASLPADFSEPVYVLVERLYKVNIKYITWKGEVNHTSETVKLVCESFKDDEKKQCEYTLGTNAKYMKLELKGAKNFIGTARQLGAFLNDLYSNNIYAKNGYEVESTGNAFRLGIKGKLPEQSLGFLRSNAFANEIRRVKINNLSDLTTWKFGADLSLSVPSSTHDDYDRETKWNEIASKNVLNDILIIRLSLSSENPKCNSVQDADNLNRSWTGSACCDPGKIYNPITKECSGKKTYTPTGATTVTYTYGCSPAANICSDKLDSEINNLNKGTISIYSKEKTNLNKSKTSLENQDLGECLLYNDKYKVTYDGKSIYCSETLETHFSDSNTSFSANFDSSYTNGKFVPINYMPSLNKKVTCYAPSTVTTDTLIKYSNSFNDKTSTMEVNVNFLGSETYTFKNSDITVKNIKTSSDNTTTYGKKYNKISFDLKYDYLSSVSSLNSFINPQTGIGTTTKVGTSQKVMPSSVNFSIPSGIAPGTYTSSVKINKLDNMISNINDETDYSKIFTSGTQGSYCVLSHNSKVTASTCTRRYAEYLNKHTNKIKAYKISYGESKELEDGKYPKSDCIFEIKYAIGEQECENLSDGITVNTEYNSTGDTTKIIFQNTKITPSLSCDFSFEVERPIPDILVYRPIDLSNPFPGKDGSGRKIGANWNGTVGSGEKEITLVEKYITNRQDAYTKKPLYSFTLTPARIKKIREDNKKHPYDEFNLNCKGEGSECFSVFIATFKNYMNKEKSSCYFETKEARTKESFNSCADYSKR